MNVSLLDGDADEDFEKSMDFDARQKTSAPSYSLLLQQALMLKEMLCQTGKPDAYQQPQTISAFTASKNM